MSICRRGPVNLSIPTFPNINLTKTITTHLLFGKSLKNDCNKFYFHPFTFNMSCKSFSYLKSLSRRSPGKFINPNFRQYQSDKSNDKFTCCLQIPVKMAKIMSICTLNPIHIRLQLPVVPW